MSGTNELKCVQRKNQLNFLLCHVADTTSITISVWNKQTKKISKNYYCVWQFGCHFNHCHLRHTICWTYYCHHHYSWGNHAAASLLKITFLWLVHKSCNIKKKESMTGDRQTSVSCLLHKSDYINMDGDCQTLTSCVHCTRPAPSKQMVSDRHFVWFHVHWTSVKAT